MKNRITNLLMKILIIFVTLASVNLYGVSKTWTGSVSTDWHTAANWSNSGIPGSDDDVTIPTSPTGGRMPIISFGLFWINKLTIHNGATLTQNGGSLAANYNISITGSFIQTAGIFSTTKDLTVHAGGSLSIGGFFSFTNVNKITIDGSTFTQSGGTVSTRDLEIKNGGAYNQTNGEFKISHDLRVSSGNTFNGTSGTVRFMGVPGPGANYTGDIQTNNLILDSLGTFKMNNDSDKIKVSGTFTNNNKMLDETKGTITFNGSGDQYIYSKTDTGKTTFANLEISNASAVVYLGSGIEVGGNVTVNNGIFDIETFALKCNSAAGILTINNNSELRIGGNYPANFNTENTSTGSTINYNGTTDQNVRYGFIRGTLKLEGSGTKTVAGGLLVNGNVVIDSNVTFNTNGNSLAVNGSIINAGNFVSTNNTGPMSFYSIQSGNLSDMDTWSNTGYLGTAATRLPGAVNNDILIIGNGKTVTLTSDVNNFGTVRVESTGKLILGNNTLSGPGIFDLRSGGSLTINSPNGINVTGNDGSIQTAIRKFGVSADYEYNGISPQVTGDGLSEFVSNLTINNSAGVTLSRSINISGNLNLTQGSLALGDNNLTLSTTSSITGTPSSSKMIITNGSGQLRKEFSGVGSFNFPVGDNTEAAEYSPVTLNFTSGNFSSAYAGVNVVNTKHPQNNSATHFINRYWKVNSSGISDFSCDISCIYTDEDIQPDGNESSIFTGRYNGSQWSVFNQANSVLNELTGTVSSFSDFTGGEPGALPVVDAQVDPTAKSFTLSQNYPNPFNPSTKISWLSPVSGWQTLKVYDILGNEVATLVSEFREAGFYEVEFSANGVSAFGRNASALTSGVYIYKITAGDFSETKKMILTK